MEKLKDLEKQLKKNNGLFSSLWTNSTTKKEITRLGSAIKIQMLYCGEYYVTALRNKKN
jgi:hypothetical protein